MKRLTALLLVCGAFACANAQFSSLSCVATAVTTLVRAEGITERLGDITLSCTGGTPSGAVTTNLTLFLPVNVTNRLGAGDTLDASLTIDSGAGPVPAPPPTLASPSSLAFNGLMFTLSPAGGAVLRISNLRAAVSQSPLSLIGQPVQVLLASAGLSSITINNSQFTVGRSVTGLLAGSSAAGIVCTASPLPEMITISNLFAAGTRFASLRLTEGAAGAFQKRGAGEDTGARFLVRYAGFPAGARLFVPDVVAGSSSVQPTAGGDLGPPASGGRYAPGASGSLLLARVFNTDPSGAGGIPAYTPGPPGSGTVSFDAASEVALAGGAGMVVYEVVDANANIQESAQFPTFLGLGPTGGGPLIVATASISFAPVSTMITASASAPIPRFAATTPPRDCTALGDCGAGYFPRLLVDATPALEYTAVAGAGHQIRYVRVNNEGGGLIVWRVSVSYQTGSGWLRVDPTDGINNASVRVDALPEQLSPGAYRATVTIDAGPLGSRTLPVTLQVTPAPPAPLPPAVIPTPLIETVVNAATFRTGPLVAGSLASVMGTRLAGGSVTVTFDGVPARLLYTSDGQINLQAPPELGAKTAAQVVVTVNGIASPPYPVTLAPIAPGIFGVLNQDGTLNTTANPAPVGTILQIFATGLPAPQAAAITAKIHDRIITAPHYAGPAPGLPGVQQVNAAVPPDLPAMRSEALVCAAAGSQAPVCSPPATIYLGR